MVFKRWKQWSAAHWCASMVSNLKAVVDDWEQVEARVNRELFGSSGEWLSKQWKQWGAALRVHELHAHGAFQGPPLRSEWCLSRALEFNWFRILFT
mmetsp:Transcript_20539/g.53554  ORF Transcript_20539/g.53554 Transcript_20539/m.53554 type:complete len:96 (-) Transcript_20539:102-389(-)